MQLKSVNIDGVVHVYFDDPSVVGFPRFYNMSYYFPTSMLQFETTWSSTFDALNAFLVTLTSEESQTLLEAYNDLPPLDCNEDNLPTKIHSFMTETGILTHLHHFVGTLERSTQWDTTVIANLHRKHTVQNDNFAKLFTPEKSRSSLMIVMLCKLFAPLLGSGHAHLKHVGIEHQPGILEVFSEGFVESLLTFDSPSVVTLLYDYTKYLTKKSLNNIDIDAIDELYRSGFSMSWLCRMAFAKTIIESFVAMNLREENSHVYIYFAKTVSNTIDNYLMKFTTR